MRKRFTGPDALIHEAERYSLSELVCEALRQLIRRYPKNRQEALQEALDASLADRMAALEEIVRQKYPQVPPGSVSGQS